MSTKSGQDPKFALRATLRLNTALGVNMNGAFVFRVVALSLCAIAIAAPSRAGTNLDWAAAFLITGVCGPLAFLWLLSQRSLADAQWGKLVSWQEPFFPMSRYPFRFWLFAGESTAFGGIAAVLVDALNKTGYFSYGATFVFLGIAMMLASVMAFARRTGRG